MTKRIGQVRFEGKPRMIFNWNKGTLLGRDGRRQVNPDPERLKIALQGHCEAAHGGKVVQDCPACTELRKGR